MGNAKIAERLINWRNRSSRPRFIETFMPRSAKPERPVRIEGLITLPRPILGARLGHTSAHQHLPSVPYLRNQKNGQIEPVILVKKYHFCRGLLIEGLMGYQGAFGYWRTRTLKYGAQFCVFFRPKNILAVPAMISKNTKEGFGVLDKGLSEMRHA